MVILDEKVYQELKDKSDKYDILLKKDMKQKERCKNYYKNNQPKFKKYYNDYYHNPDKKPIVDAIRNRYLTNNKEKIKDRSRLYYIKNREKMLQYSKDRQARLTRELKAEKPQ
jgi:hypothetical protein